VKPTLQKLLADSHVAAIIIALLMIWSVDATFQALWRPLYRVARCLFTAVAIWDVPYFSWTMQDWAELSTTVTYLCSLISYIVAAWLLSRLVYGVGPLRTLSDYRCRIAGREDA